MRQVINMFNILNENGEPFVPAFKGESGYGFYTTIFPIEDKPELQEVSIVKPDDRDVQVGDMVISSYVPFPGNEPASTRGNIGEIKEVIGQLNPSIPLISVKVEYKLSVKGDNGADGADGTNGTDGITPNIQIGAVNTLSPDEDATATITGSIDNPLLNLGIPKGIQGEQGPQGEKGDTGLTPNLTVGTVTTLEPTQDATVTITGTTDNPVLNYGIPKGVDGTELYLYIVTFSVSNPGFSNNKIYIYSTSDNLISNVNDLISYWQQLGPIPLPITGTYKDSQNVTYILDTIYYGTHSGTTGFVLMDLIKSDFTTASTIVITTPPLVAVQKKKLQ